MGFHGLRVINEDWVEPSQGFPTHGHRDMEIVTFIIEGELQHKDSMGNGSVIRPGDIQYMSAGSGVTHSEFNPSDSTVVHLLQIWIQPNVRGAKPRYAQEVVPLEDRRKGWVRFPVDIRQDAGLSVTVIPPGVERGFKPQRKRPLWVQVVRGEIGLGGESFGPGDGVGLEDVSDEILIRGGREEAEVILFELF
jgi:redox-sensitive bicupin YhaK (pirin superfamily)